MGDDQTAADLAAECDRIDEEAAQDVWEEMRTLAEERDALRARAEAADQRAKAAEAEVERLRVLGPDTEARVTIEARRIATDVLRPTVEAWRAEVARVAAGAAAARAEGEAAGRAAVWRHIAEAPRDGSRILLFFPDTRFHEAMVAEGFFDILFDGVWMLSRGSSALDLRVCSPTHWAPLPEPPVAGTAR